MARPWPVLAAALGVAAVLAATGLDARLSRGLRDAQLRWLAPTSAAPDTVIFDIDDASLAALKADFGAWPFKRDVYALAIEQLRDLGARAIAIDLLFADGHEGDAALQRAIARPGAPVVLAAAGLNHAAADMPPPAALSAVAASGPAYRWPALALPAAGVLTPQPRLGVITSPLDDDGVLRRLPLWHRDGSASAPQLPLMPLALHRAAGGDVLPAWAIDSDGALHLAFAAPSARPQRHAFAELAAVALGRADPATLRAAVQGRAVFIGSSALLADTVMTPAGQTRGTEALAQAYTALGVHGTTSAVRPPSTMAQTGLLLLALAPACWTLRRGRVQPRADAAAALLALLLIAAAASGALLHGRQPLDLAAPLATVMAAWATAAWRHQRDQAARESALAQQLAVAAATSKAKSEFLSNVSHEIRTPMNALLGVAELLAATPLSAEQRTHVQVFRDAGQALLTLINDLLDLSRIEAGHLELRPEPFAPRVLLQHVQALMRPRAEMKGLMLQVDIDADVPEGLLGDRLRIEQSLLNLLGNAIKFTSHGQVRLHVTAPSPGWLRMAVSDTGIGIAPSKREAIFEPFAQADGSITRQFGGTGLGLAIVRATAARMGGSVQVHSTPGVGSTFTLELPLPEAAVAPDHAVAAPLPAPNVEPAFDTAPVSVLLAEDNEVNVYIFRAMLVGRPVALDVAPNGPTALELLQRRRYALAFVDIQMPGMDGLTVTRELRRFEAETGRARTPVVALTANAFDTDVQASLAAGCDRHLSKPVSQPQLLQALSELAALVEPEAAATLPAALDEAGAIARLGGDAALYGRIVEHARVFIEGWQAGFAQAVSDGQLAQAHRLSHDLAGIAATLGALDLSQAARALEQALRHQPDDPPPAELVAAVQQTMQPVLISLSLR